MRTSLLSKEQLVKLLSEQGINEPPPKRGQVLVVAFPRAQVLRAIGVATSVVVSEKGEDMFELKEIL